MEILEMMPADIPAVVNMAQILYREDDAPMLAKEFEEIVRSETDAVYVARQGETYVGFIHMALRYEYVEGAGEPPVAYMEGIYVDPDFRQQQIARELSREGEKWAKEKGCTQVASDAEIDNTVSQAFHQKIGFKEVNRLVCFLKDIDDAPL